MKIVKTQSLLILLAYTIVLFLSEILYRYVFDIPSLGNYFESFFVVFIFVSLFYFSKCKVTRFIIGLFFIGATLINNIHYDGLSELD